MAKFQAIFSYETFRVRERRERGGVGGGREEGEGRGREEGGGRREREGGGRRGKGGGREGGQLII